MLDHQFLWAGDQNTNWQPNDGLPSLVRALLSSAASGVTVNHGDIGGFTTFKKGFFKMTRDRELLKRWIELCAFTGVYRTHESIAPSINLQVYDDADIAHFFAKFSEIRDDMKPYLLSAAAEAMDKNVPIVRPVWWHYPTDSITWTLEEQFLLGREILVLPVLEKGKTTVRGYFPKGEWKHFFTKEITHSQGEWKTVAAPIGTPAVYVLQ